MSRSDELLAEANRLFDQVVAGKSNEPPAMAWGGVCRACAKANDAKRAELAPYAATGYTRLELNWFNGLERIWWIARAQLETLQRAAQAA